MAFVKFASFKLTLFLFNFGGCGLYFNIYISAVLSAVIVLCFLNFGSCHKFT